MATPDGSGFNAQQIENAKIIAQVGHQVGASQRDIQIALMTAMQESSLENLNYGDRDSLGLFQQRGAWGSAQARMDPAAAAQMFFLGGQGGQRGLLGISNRNSLSLTEAAQAVQVSAFPSAYAKWQMPAEQIMGQLGFGAPSGDITTPTGASATLPGLDPTKTPDVTPNTTQVDTLGAVTADKAGIGALKMPEIADQAAALSPFGSNAATGAAATGATATPAENHTDQYKMPTLDDLGLTPEGLPQSHFSGADGWRSRVIGAAMKMLGTPYVWGGTTPGLGLDCSGLVQAAFKQAGMSMPRLSWDQASQGKQVPLSELKPGDLVAWHNDSQHPGATHIAIWLGNNQILQAPHPGASVEVSQMWDPQQAWGVQLGGH